MCSLHTAGKLDKLNLSWIDLAEPRYTHEIGSKYGLSCSGIDSRSLRAVVATVAVGDSKCLILTKLILVQDAAYASTSRTVLTPPRMLDEL